MIYPWSTYSIRIFIVLALLLMQSAHAGKCHRGSKCFSIVLRAAEAYNGKDYETARRLFMDAYQISSRPEILINIGCSLYELHKYADALAMFDKFILLHPRSSHLDKVRRYRARAAEDHKPLSDSTEALSLPFEPRLPRPNVLPPLHAVLPAASDGSIPLRVSQLPSDADMKSTQRRKTLFTALGSLSVAIGTVGIVAGASCYGALSALQDRFRGSVDEFDKDNMLTEAGHLRRASTASYVSGGIIGALGVSMLAIVGYHNYKRKTATVTSVSFSGLSQGTNGHKTITLEGRF